VQLTTPYGLAVNYDGNYYLSVSLPKKFSEKIEGKYSYNDYNDQQYSILCKEKSMFHLSALEATYIKTLKPILSR